MLNLTRSQHTLVGNLSGGEYKRLSIGVEMVTNPPIMFFDEPTSGLDSVATYQIISYLRKLARDGRLIVCVVHQPSSRLMKLFDDILVVSRGCVLYSGPQDEMLGHFQKSGFECPQYYNPADYGKFFMTNSRTSIIRRFWSFGILVFWSIQTCFFVFSFKIPF